MQQIAFGQLKMSTADFWDSTPREFFNRIFATNHMEKNLFEREQLNVRQILYWITMNNPYIESRDKPKSFSDFNEQFTEKKKQPLKEEVVMNFANLK